MNQKDFAIVILGAGAAGAMAAIAAAGGRSRVLLLEGNEKLGKKIYITGKGRCNLTNVAPMPDSLKNYVHQGKFLYSAFAALDNQATMDFFEKQGLPLKVERGGRVFPLSDHASDVNKTLEKCLRARGVDFRTHCHIRHMHYDSQAGLFELEGESGTRFRAKKVILACGGASYPSTGSKGEGYTLARSLGHTIRNLRPALVPFLLEEPFLADWAGLSLKNVQLNASAGKKKWQEFGEMLFTHQGISGPIVLTLSSKLPDQIPEDLRLSLDWKPSLSKDQLLHRLKRERDQGPNRQLDSLFRSFLPKGVVSEFLSRGGWDKSQPFHSFRRQEEELFIDLLKDFRLHFVSLAPWSQAITTRGGVATKEINPSTMESRLLPGLYFAGEMIDCDGLTGGYNLQMAFSTGFLAGKSALESEEA